MHPPVLHPTDQEVYTGRGRITGDIPWAYSIGGIRHRD